MKKALCLFLFGVLVMPGCGSGSGSNISSPTATTAKYVYVANFGDNTISQYTSSANGSLIAMTPATVATGNGPYSITVAPSGKYAYVANRTDNTVSQFMIGTNGHGEFKLQVHHFEQIA